MATLKTSQSLPSSRKRGPSRSLAGVIATLEELTGIKPCPRELRDTANKYLRSKLFLQRRSERGSYETRLAQPGARTLLMNALNLDEIFRGNTALVVSILLGEVDKNELDKRCTEATRDIERRARVYVYWQQRMPAVQAVLSGKVDLAKERLEALLDNASATSTDKVYTPFALRAVRTLERAEQGRRSYNPSTSDLVEQADAYLMLGDHDAATARARQATELDPTNTRAWFIRVVAVLKQRNRALSETKRYRLEATEAAEPMSAHERSAHEAADEAAMQASTNQEMLDRIVPEALLHWPTGTWGQHEHSDWRALVRDLMLAQAFRKILMGDKLGSSRRALELNGLAEEGRLMLDAPQIPGSANDASQELPLRQSERETLTLLFAEHDRYPFDFFDLTQGNLLAHDLKLLHLRWVLGNDGYEQHWQAWSNHRSSFPPDHFEHSVLRDETLAPLWFSHEARHGGVTATHAVMKQWQQRVEHDRARSVGSHCLELYVLAFHHQLARNDLAGCWQTCDLAVQLVSDGAAGAGSYRHPLEPSITVPVGSVLYWQYLRALAAVLVRAARRPMDAKSNALLAEADTLRQAFEAQERCFWTLSQEYDEGASEEYLVAPYDIDLREIGNWTKPTRGRDQPLENVHIWTA